MAAGGGTRGALRELRRTKLAPDSALSGYSLRQPEILASFVRPSAVWCCVVRASAVWCCVVRPNAVWCGLVRCGAVWFSMIVQYESTLYNFTRITYFAVSQLLSVTKNVAQILPCAS